MALLAKQTPTIGGTVAAYAAASAGGDSLVNSGREFLAVKNGGGSSINVTISSGSNKCSFGVSGSNHDKVVAVAAGAEQFIGPFDKNQFNDVNGQVQITYSAVTSVTVAVLASA